MPTVTQQTIAHRRILGVRVNASHYAETVDQVIEWAESKTSRYVCLATVNNIMEARDSPDYARVMEAADLVTSDGMPLVWALRLLGAPASERVYGPDLTPLLLREAEARGLPVGFYGGTPQVLELLTARLHREFPRLRIDFLEAPPFRPPSLEEDRATIAAIRASGIRLLFVGLGSPKQDRWMHDHRDRLDAVMLGVGAAFDFLAGVKKQAPRWMQRSGLEWLFRLASEPLRLARRYLKHNPRFLFLFALQLFMSRERSERF